MKNIAAMMKQAQEMQSRMADMETRQEQVEIHGSAGGGMVALTLNGKGDMKRLKIDPKLADPAEVEVLEDLVIAAFNDARTKVTAAMAEEMAKITGGLKLPAGLKLPF